MATVELASPERRGQDRYREGFWMSQRTPVVLVSGMVFLLAAPPAEAIGADAAASALAAALAGGSRGTVTFDAATESGGDVIVEGLTIVDGQGKNNLRFPEVVIEAPSETGNGIFEAARVRFGRGEFTGAAKGSLAGLVLAEVMVLDPQTVGSSGPGNGVLFHSAEATDLRLARDGEEGEIAVARIHVENGSIVDNVPLDSRGTVEQITLPPQVFDDGGLDPAALGYDSIVLDVSWDGVLEPAEKMMTLRDFSVSIKDGGALSVAGTIRNLPPASALNDADAPAKASEIEIHSITVRYEDDSLAARVLDFLAAQQGLTRAQYAEQVAAALPFLLASLNNPEFQAKVAAALGDFLRDPRSLTVSIDPADPISGARIMELATTTPQALPDLLNADVTANAPK
jgi:hypothetical protein